MKDLLSEALLLIIAVPILGLVFKYGPALFMMILTICLAGGAGLASLGCFCKNGIINKIFGIGLACMSLGFLLATYGIFKTMLY